jgi:hypothetical protein
MMRSGVVARVGLGACVIALPALTVPAGAITFLPVCALPALFLIAGLLFGRDDPSAQPPSRDDDAGNGGSPPPHPPPRPDGGVPLPSADRARVRLRDQHSSDAAPSRPRRRRSPLGIPDRSR